jgi:putative membrane protein
MNTLLIYFKGMLMGMADLIPGVSGGTIALITGIYQRLINAIAAVNWQVISQLFSGRFRQAWQAIDGWFLLTLFAGILTAVFVFASLLSHLLSNHPQLTWAFFFGLIICAAVMLLSKNRSAQPISWLVLMVGVLLGYLLSTQSMGVLPAGLSGVFLAGMIAISAMILPGISGSLILILLGQYQHILTAVEQREWSTLLTFAAGCVVGLMIFSRILKWLLAHFYQATLYGLAGLMLGTLFKVWPWQLDGNKVMPWVHPEPQWLPCLLLMGTSCLLVWLLFKLDRPATRA